MRRLKELVLVSVFIATITILPTMKEKEYEFSVEGAHIETGNTVNTTKQATGDWDKFIEAVIWKESEGKENAIGDGGKAVGVLQIHPIMVREANRILEMKGKPQRYAYDDRYSREKSIEMFKIVQDYHNKSHDFEKALEIWNKNHPASYKNLIMDKYRELIS